VALTSRMEGGSNVLCEALAAGVPVVASRIPGLVGTLGEDFAGYFEAGDTEGLAALMSRAERDRGFYDALARHVAARAQLASPERERQAWAALLAEVGE
jgi:glycosyltransferase involved in cell wall biosynthesis